jgi:hypothetical protein
MRTSPATRARHQLMSLAPTCALALLASGPLYASPDADPQHAAANALPLAPVQSIFHIAKSENRNQVHYGVQVDAACRPVGAQPVYSYWREFKRGPEVTSRLLDLEQPAYGLSEPRYVRDTASGGQIRISLRALPRRPLIIDVFRSAGHCAARTVIAIDQQAAVLTSIYVDIGFLFSVNYALVQGIRVADGRLVQEKIRRGAS